MNDNKKIENRKYDFKPPVTIRLSKSTTLVSISPFVLRAKHTRFFEDFDRRQDL